MSACVQTIQLHLQNMQAMSLIDNVNRYYCDNISVALLNTAVGERSAYDIIKSELHIALQIPSKVVQTIIYCF